MIVLHNFIQGRYEAPRSGRYLDNHNPATGEVYATPVSLSVFLSLQALV